MNNLIHKIENRLKLPLPGIKAQYKLAPEYKTTPKSKLEFDQAQDYAEAGVLILLYPQKNGELFSVLMKRPKYNGPHSAQISLPGGKKEIFDSNLEATALRESKEEIGINPKEIKILGKLSKLFIPVSNYLVSPYVGYSNRVQKFKIDPHEVDYLIEYPLKTLNTIEVSYTKKSHAQQLHTIPYLDIQNEFVWGATSMMLSEFIEILNGN